MSATVRGLEMGNPPHVETLHAQTEIVGIEVTGGFNVSDRNVGDNAGYVHLSS
jgi:hypothetical protein